MTQQEFDQFLVTKAVYTQNNRTKSSNEGVLEVYAYILGHELSDSEWWSGGHGSSDLLGIITYFEPTIWTELEKDITNWSPDQIEIFAQSLLAAYPEVPEQYKVAERLDFYLTLLDQDILYNELCPSFEDWCQLDLRLTNPDSLKRMAIHLELEKYDPTFFFQGKNPYTQIRVVLYGQP